MTGSLGVQVSAFLARLAAALAVAAIIEGEYGRAGFEKRPVEAEPVTDVSAISMAIEEHYPAANRIHVRRKKPPVQFDAIAGFEEDIFKGPAHLRAAGFESARRMIDPAMFKPAQ